MEAISAREEQCFQLEDDISKLNSLLTNTERELIEKEQAIAALERKLRIGKASFYVVHLEFLIGKITYHQVLL